MTLRSQHNAFNTQTKRGKYKVENKKNTIHTGFYALKNQLKNQVDRNTESLEEAMKRGKTKKALKKLEKNINTNFKDSNGDDLLIIAIKNKQFKIAKKLIEKGIDPTNSLLLSAEKGYTDVIEYLLTLTKASDDIPEYPVYGTLEEKIAFADEYLSDSSEVRSLVDINRLDEYGYDALMIAAVNENDDIVDILLNNGADFYNAINCLNVKGNRESALFIFNKKVNIMIETNYHYTEITEFLNTVKELGVIPQTPEEEKSYGNIINKIIDIRFDLTYNNKATDDSSSSALKAEEYPLYGTPEEQIAFMESLAQPTDLSEEDQMWHDLASIGRPDSQPDLTVPEVGPMGFTTYDTPDLIMPALPAIGGLPGE